MQYLLQVHSVPEGLYEKIMYGLPLYAGLEKLPIVEKKAAHCTSLSPTGCLESDQYWKHTTAASVDASQSSKCLRV